MSPDPTATALQDAAQHAGGFIYAPLPSGGAFVHLAGVARPIHLRDKREVFLWTHAYLAGHQHMRDTTRAAVAAAEVAADAPC